MILPPPPPRERQAAGLAKKRVEVRISEEAPVFRLTNVLREWDVPEDNEGEDDIWWRGLDLHDQHAIGWRWHDPALADAGILVTKVAGVMHHEGLPRPAFAPGKRLLLVPEPDNPYDPKAIGVWDSAHSVQVGYLPRTVASGVCDALGSGATPQAVSLAEFVKKPNDTRVGIRILIAPSGLIEGWPE
jgi:hypothetical protein